MTTFTIESYGGTGQLRVLNGTEGTPALDGTSVTYSDPANFPGVVLTLTGTGITGTPSATWNITGIQETFMGNLGWTLTGLTGIDGAPTSGAFDPASIFQALAFHDTFDLIFGHDSTLIGSPIAHSTTLFGGPGNDVLIARGGNTKLDGGGGFDTLSGAKTGHDVFEFNSTLNPAVNLDTIRGFSPTRDLIELSQPTFGNIHHLGALTAAEFHGGFGAPSTTGADIVYNQSNGHLYYDSNGHNFGGLHLFAILANHAALTASDFLVI
jgi:Ca2+-binding RTX toxin-like protein